MINFLCRLYIHSISSHCWSPLWQSCRSWVTGTRLWVILLRALIYWLKLDPLPLFSVEIRNLILSLHNRSLGYIQLREYNLPFFADYFTLIGLVVFHVAFIFVTEAWISRLVLYNGVCWWRYYIIVFLSSSAAIFKNRL